MTPLPTRSQLSLFVPPDVGAELEAIRRIVDPVQSALIPAHVTLCREDELTGLRIEDIASRLAESAPAPLSLQFGPPERFGGHGLLLPCISDTAAFEALRAIVLGAPPTRPQVPHLTLAHPRNPRAVGNELGNAERLRGGRSITFTEVRLIEQEGAFPWEVRGVISLLAPRGEVS